MLQYTLGFNRGSVSSGVAERLGNTDGGAERLGNTDGDAGRLKFFSSGDAEKKSHQQTTSTAASATPRQGRAQLTAEQLDTEQLDTGQLDTEQLICAVPSVD